ncbi:MAG: glycosyl hydrolase family 65 protein, partial [Nakamurella sp.]
LSASTQAVMAAETGHLDLAYDYLAEAALMDLDDLEHNTRDGLHVASLAGTWIALVPGLAGLRERSGSVAFAPRLPAGITRLAVTIRIQNSRLNVEISSTKTTYRVIDGESVTLLHHGQPLTVSAESPVSASNPKALASPKPSQPRNRAPTPHP